MKQFKDKPARMKQICKNCIHWKKCSDLICDLANGDAVCNWNPSRFIPVNCKQIKEFNEWFIHQLYQQESGFPRYVLQDCKDELFKAWLKRDSIGEIKND